MSNRYAIQYDSHLTNAGKFFTALVTKHYMCKSIPHIETLDNKTLNKHNTKTVVIPYIRYEFKERLLTLWEIDSKREEFDTQFRMIDDYLFDVGHKYGNTYKDLRDERINREDPPITLRFIDIGKLLAFDDREYEQLVLSLNTKPLSTDDWIGGDWKNYVEQYRTQLEVLNKR